MDPVLMMNLVLAGVIVLVLAALLGNAAAFVGQLFAGQGGGWRQLARQFATRERPSGRVLSWQTIQVGQVVYKRCATISAEPGGLYLDVGMVWRRFGKPPLLIPWHEIKRQVPTVLRWQAAVTLSIGEPVISTITLQNHLFQQVSRGEEPDILTAELISEPIGVA